MGGFEPAGMSETELRVLALNRWVLICMVSNGLFVI